MHDLFVGESSVLVADEALRGGGMLSGGLHACARAAELADIVIHDPVKAIVVPFDRLSLPLLENIIQQVIVFFLNGSSA
jgi:hypothetical protein